jgi:hypothetical protein
VSVAVLPFANLGRYADDEYLSDGLAGVAGHVEEDEPRIRGTRLYTAVTLLGPDELEDGNLRLR